MEKQHNKRMLVWFMTFGAFYGTLAHQTPLAVIGETLAWLYIGCLFAAGLAVMRFSWRVIRFFMRFSWEFATKKQDLRWVRRAMRRGAVAGIYFGALTGADAQSIFVAGPLIGLCAASVYMLGKLLAEFLMKSIKSVLRFFVKACNSTL